MTQFRFPGYPVKELKSLDGWIRACRGSTMVASFITALEAEQDLRSIHHNPRFLADVTDRMSKSGELENLTKNAVLNLSSLLSDAHVEYTRAAEPRPELPQPLSALFDKWLRGDTRVQQTAQQSRAVVREALPSPSTPQSPVSRLPSSTRGDVEDALFAARTRSLLFPTLSCDETKFHTFNATFCPPTKLVQSCQKCGFVIITDLNSADSEQ